MSEEDENIDVADVGGWFDLGYQNLEGSWRTVASRAKEVVALSGPHALSSSKRTNEELEAAVKLLTDFEDLVTEKPLKNVEIPAVGEAKN